MMILENNFWLIVPMAMKMKMVLELLDAWVPGLKLILRFCPMNMLDDTKLKKLTLTQLKMDHVRLQAADITLVEQ